MTIVKVKASVRASNETVNQRECVHRQRMDGFKELRRGMVEPGWYGGTENDLGGAWSGQEADVTGKPRGWSRKVEGREEEEAVPGR